MTAATPNPSPPHVSTRITSWLRTWVPVLRLAWRDAARHRARTVLATLLIALPITAVIAGAGLTGSAPPARESALGSIPDGAQAILTATALPSDSAPFPQIPEGAPGPWIDELEQIPAESQALASLLPAEDRLLPYWNSPDLLATTGLDLAPGEQAPAGSGVADVEGLDLAAVTSTTLQEVAPDAMGMLLPDLSAGSPPADGSQVVISTALASRLGVGIGDTLALVAPPPTGWFGAEGRIAEVVADSQRAYRVVGLAEDTAQRAWAPSGWMSTMVDADPAGVDRHWLVVGDEPVTWDQAKELNALQTFAISRHVLQNYPSSDELYPVGVNVEAALARVALLVMGGPVGAVLVLFLITPAFSVSTEQSRRTLGLAAATGAAPADLRRIVMSQGLVIGAAGGLLGATMGTVLGIIAARLRWPGADVVAHFPWWVVPAAIGVAVLLGVIAALLPARSASKLQPVDALKNRAPRPGHNAVGGSRSRRWLPIAGPVMLLVGAGCAALSLALPPPPPPDPLAPPSQWGPPMWLVAPMVLALLLVVGGMMLSVSALTALGARLAGRFSVAPRLALRDAADHPSRFAPAAMGVLVAVLAASYLTVLTGSSVANERDRIGEMVAGGRMVLAPAVPVSDAFDQLVVADTLHMLSEQLPVTGQEPVWSTPTDSDVRLGVLQPSDRRCPDDLYPDTASAVSVDAALHCVDYDHSYQPGLAVPWLLGGDEHVMDGAAMRASGLPGADDAATVLDLGGVVVNNAAMLSRSGTVRVAIYEQGRATEAEAERIVELPGAFVRGFAPLLTLSPDTARAIGVADLRYVGGYVDTTRELTQQELAQAGNLVRQHTELIMIATPQFPYPWGTTERLIPTMALAALAITATIISLFLARTQATQDLQTMRAVGAPPTFARRYTLTQAGVVLVAGLPLGLLAGIAFGAYLVAWNRRIGFDGAWLQTSPLWGIQVALVLAIVVVGLASAALLGPIRRSQRPAG